MGKEVSVEDLRGLLENNKRLVALGDPKRMLQFILDEAIRMTGAERGFVILFEGDADQVKSARNFDRESLKKTQSKFSRTILSQVKESRQAVLIMDAERDERVKDAPSIMEMSLRSVLAVPIQMGQDLLGVIYLDNRFTEGAFQENQVRLVGLFADQVALSLQTLQSLELAEQQAREMKTLQRQLSQLNETLQEKVSQVEQERDRTLALLETSPLNREFSGIVGTSKALKKVFRTIRQLKDSDPSVYIHGESGTGKELMARALHRNSPRSKGPFVAVNCAAFSESILDSELFGHVKGAFTGADRDRRGLFEEAHDGTVFLDEVGEMSPGMQAKLLRVLQEGEIRPVGANRSRKIDVRVISASNKDLKKLVEQGTFREDLYYRLNVLRIDLPPLRERVEDISDLVSHFMRHNRQNIPEAFLSVDEDALALLMDYSWPGNIRELQNEIERCLILGKGHIRSRDLSPAIREIAQNAPPLSEGKNLAATLIQTERTLLIKALETHRGNKTETAQALGVSRAKLYQLMRKHRLGSRYGQLTLAEIRRVLRETGGNKSQAARRLGIGRRTLYDLLEG